MFSIKTRKRKRGLEGYVFLEKMVKEYINQSLCQLDTTHFSSHLHFFPTPIRHMSLRYLNTGFKKQEHHPILFF